MAMTRTKANALYERMINGLPLEIDVMSQMVKTFAKASMDNRLKTETRLCYGDRQTYMLGKIVDEMNRIFENER